MKSLRSKLIATTLAIVVVITAVLGIIALKSMNGNTRDTLEETFIPMAEQSAEIIDLTVENQQNAAYAIVNSKVFIEADDNAKLDYIENGLSDECREDFAIFDGSGNIIKSHGELSEHEKVLAAVDAAVSTGKPVSSEIEANNDDFVGYTIAVPDGEALYIALDYVKQYTNFSYELFTEPNRIQLRTEWGSRESATINKDTNVRIKGGIKSPILRPIEEGESVVILEEMETWTKVKTTDAMMGYVENKYLADRMTEEEIPVTDYEEPVYTSWVACDLCGEWQ